MGLIIDCFAGGGGASVGIEMALGRLVDIAVNHDPKAIREADRQPEHVSKAVELMKFTAGNLDCEVVGRIVLRDKKTGRVWP